MKKTQPAILAAARTSLRVNQPERLTAFEHELASAVGGMRDDGDCTPTRTCCGLDDLGRMVLDDC